MPTWIATPTIEAMDNHADCGNAARPGRVALLIHAIDPLSRAHYIVAIYVVLALYMVYSTTLLVLAMRHSPVIPAAIALWADVAWYVVLIGISDGADSVFFSLFFLLDPARVLPVGLCVRPARYPGIHGVVYQCGLCHGARPLLLAQPFLAAGGVTPHHGLYDGLNARGTPRSRCGGGWRC